MASALSGSGRGQSNPSTSPSPDWSTMRQPRSRAARTLARYSCRLAGRMSKASMSGRSWRQSTRRWVIRTANCWSWVVQRRSCQSWRFLRCAWVGPVGPGGSKVMPQLVHTMNCSAGTPGTLLRRPRLRTVRWLPRSHCMTRPGSLEQPGLGGLRGAEVVGDVEGAAGRGAPRRRRSAGAARRAWRAWGRRPGPAVRSLSQDRQLAAVLSLTVSQRRQMLTVGMAPAPSALTRFALRRSTSSTSHLVPRA